MTGLSKQLEFFFLFHVVAVLMIASGILPRHTSFILLGAWLWIVSREATHRATLLFIRTIPFFIALPITAGFDNFNMWRLVLLILFARFLWQTRSGSFDFKRAFVKRGRFRFEWLALALVVLAALSLIGAPDLIAGIRRVIYFANAALLYVLVRHYIARQPAFLKTLAVNVTIVLALVVGLGIFQQVLAYVVPIDVFQHLFGDGIQRNWFGTNWSHIVMEMGNTWYSYFEGAAPRLRMFSVFPDSHSFPLFVLAALPFVAILTRVVKASRFIDLAILLLFSGLALVLSGTRGIWLTFIFGLAVIGYIAFVRRDLWVWFKPTVIALGAVVVAVPLATAAYYFTQFRSDAPEIGKERTFIFRWSSTFDVEEKSNSGRMLIWSRALDALVRRPLSGVGIGNFPRVLGQDIRFAKAGSSAHNLYLNVAAEMGALALIVFVLMFVELLRRAWQTLSRATSPDTKVFLAGAVTYLVWIYAYSLTDAALFDERALLMFLALAASVSGLFHSLKRLPTSGF